MNLVCTGELESYYVHIIVRLLSDTLAGCRVSRKTAVVRLKVTLICTGEYVREKFLEHGHLARLTSTTEISRKREQQRNQLIII